MNLISDNELRTRLAALADNGKRKRLAREGYHTAGVLVPLVFGSVAPELLFTKRTEIVETHKGQVSFPGGTTDPADGDVIHTALREAWEEVGIPGSAVEVVGMLDDLLTPTGFIITPVVGILGSLPALSPNADEVADVFLVPLWFFADPQNGRTELREFRGKQHEVWYYTSGNHTIWGATAMIVRSLLQRLEIV
jgi:8-oxo-dGTP pyrophosphatase MutT (NUDIX family)